MAQIKYLGPDDFRVLDASDLKKIDANADFKKTTFAQGATTDVSDAASAAILGNADLYGKFAAVEAQTPLKAEAPADSKGKSIG